MTSYLITLLVTIGLLSCQSIPSSLPALSGKAAQHYLASLRESDKNLEGLRGIARVSIAGRVGESFSKQIVLLRRPASLRVEVLGVLNQRIAVLATDGNGYDLYHAEGNQFESGLVKSDILFGMTGIPLNPEQIVNLVLGIPVNLIDSKASVKRSIQGKDLVRVQLCPSNTNVCHDLYFGVEGSLRLYQMKSSEGNIVLEVRYKDFRYVRDLRFAHSITFRIPGDRVHATLSFRELEINPNSRPELFRLSQEPK